MLQISADDLNSLLDYPSLVNAIDDAFRSDVTVPVRHHHTLPVEAGQDATLLLMPAWNADKYTGVKIVMVTPDNAALGNPAVNGTYQLFDRLSGKPLALIDGAVLTARRTASASALASRYLSRPDTRHLLVVGTGVLAPHLVRAHASQRPIEQVTIWGRSLEKAQQIAEQLSDLNLNCQATDKLEPAVKDADLISCATLSKQPLIKGDWLQQGQHVDLVGGFTPLMREADDQCLIRSQVFADTRAGAMIEAGDLCDPLARGVISEKDVRADLFDLARGTHTGRANSGEITLFKSAGTAIEDLAGACLAYERKSAV